MKSSSSNLAVFSLRIVLGVVFIAHGGQKVFGWWQGPGIEEFAQHLQKGGMPIFLAYLAAFTEFFGGIAVFIGLLTRLASLGLMIVMAVAIFTVHWHNGFFGQNHGFEYPFTLFGIAFSLFLSGAGSISMDSLIFTKKNS